MADNTYQLTIEDLHITGGSTKVVLTYNSQWGGQQVDIKNAKGVFVSCRICELSYSKAVYRPGNINFTLLFTWTGTTPAVDDFYTIFDSCVVNLDSIAEKKLFSIAKTYYIFNIQLERWSASKSQMYVNFEAYSPDKYLTLDTYCKAYVGRKLIADIISNRDLWPDAVALFGEVPDEKSDNGSDEKSGKATNNLPSLLELNPRFLNYDIVIKDENDNAVTTTYEYIQPYLVQYNESFFDFIVRTTSRCGEFFYYEEGKFKIGWAAPSENIYIDNFASIRYSKGKMTAWKTGSLSEVHNDYTTNTNKLTSSGAKMMRDSELASDENLSPIPSPEEYTTWQDFALWPEAYWINLVSSSLNQATVIDMIDYMVWNGAVTQVSSQKLSDKTNGDYKSNYFDEEKEPYIKERAYASANSGDEIDKNKIYPYSTTPLNSKDSVTFGLAFYDEIQKGIAEAEQARIHVVLENNFYPVALGSLICFEDNDKSGGGKSYIVVKIDHVVKSDIHSNKHGAAPHGHEDDFGTYGEMLEIEAIPYVAGSPVYPPSANVSSIRVSNAQRAIVTHNADPLKLGRVRVRYPWQQGTDDATPWIRIALPMASKDSGFRFIPEVGDEAVINYENGNIERPYVEGMLFSNERQPSYPYKPSNFRVFSSVNGHSIIFSDATGRSNTISTFSPLWGTLTSFIPTLNTAVKVDWFKKATGGIEFTDEYGLYSLSMSSDKRTISIKSPLGKVSINAFTGINISAPNGNVKIEGKNVEIVAGNNLTLRSGVNRNFGPFESFKSTSALVDLGVSTVGTMGAFAVGKFTIIDLSSLRTAFEVMLRPIAGTLRISSKRFLCLEAGKGTAEIMNRRVIEKGIIPKPSSAGSYFLRKYATKNNPNEVLTSQIPELLTEAYWGIKRLFQTYISWSSKLTQSVIDCQRFLEALGRKGDLSPYLTDTRIPDVKAIYDNRITEPLSMKDLDDSENLVAVDEIKNLVNAINERAHIICLIRNLEDNVSVKGILPKEWQFLCENLEGEIKKIVESVLPSVTMDTLSNGGFPDRGTLDMDSFRSVMFELLKKMVGRQPIESGQYSCDCITASQIGTPKDFGDANWHKFIDDIELSSSSRLKDFGKYAGSLGLKITGLEKFKGVFDQYTWDSAEGGKILFSDESGKTLSINQKEFQIYKESRSIDTAQDAIPKIKTILGWLS